MLFLWDTRRDHRDVVLNILSVGQRSGKTCTYGEFAFRKEELIDSADSQCYDAPDRTMLC